ncbi:glycosyltransferase family 2 protein [Synechococcus sp. Tobar12-5m-g]|nr:glycosyltransferase family 2 protein [Synechococcus sp. Tobar12-5m-g]
MVAPVHNIWEYLPDCIDRVRGQAFDDLELVLVDDASPDGSLPLLKDYALRDDRVRIVSHSHSLGQGPAKNTGDAFPRGSCLFFLDSDDRLASPDVLNH